MNFSEKIYYLERILVEFGFHMVELAPKPSIHSQASLEQVLFKVLSYIPVITRLRSNFCFVVFLNLHLQNQITLRNSELRLVRRGVRG